MQTFSRCTWRSFSGVIVTFFIHNFIPSDVVTNRTTITFNVFFTKFCLFHCFFRSQTFCFFFLASSLIRAIFRCHNKTYFLPVIRYLFCVQLVEGCNIVSFRYKTTKKGQTVCFNSLIFCHHHGIVKESINDWTPEQRVGANLSLS